MLAAQRVEGAHRSHGETAGDERGSLVMCELDPCPLVQEVGADVGQREAAVHDEVPDRALHERVGDDDEVARQPAPYRHADRGREMEPWTKTLRTPEQRADERA